MFFFLIKCFKFITNKPSGMGESLTYLLSTAKNAPLIFMTGKLTLKHIFTNEYYITDTQLNYSLQGSDYWIS